MKLTPSYTKKVPGQEEYSSEGFGATIEVEVPEEQSQDATVVQQWLQELYDQAKQARSKSRSRTFPGETGIGRPPRLPACSAGPMATSPSARAPARASPRANR